MTPHATVPNPFAAATLQGEELTTSRRTPPGWLAYLRQHLEPGLLRRLSLHDWRGLEPDWLVQRLPLADSVWVSEDSVSMVYEALTAGAHPLPGTTRPPLATHRDKFRPLQVY